MLQNYRTKAILNTVVCYVSNQCTMRDVAKLMNISKSTVHKRITDFIASDDECGYYKQLAYRAKMLVEQNKEEKHIRGGLATKKKFAKAKQN